MPVLVRTSSHIQAGFFSFRVDAKLWMTLLTGSVVKTIRFKIAMPGSY